MTAFVKDLLRKMNTEIRHLLVFTALIFGVFSSSCSPRTSRPDPCLERRAVFDIGSGSTKLKIADLNICEGRILRIVFEKARPVDYAAALSKSSAQMLSGNIRKQGVSAIESLIAESKSLSPRKSIAIMTGVFRKAQNANDFRAHLQRRFGFRFQILTQAFEARYGFESVRASLKEAPERLVVWDIGGATMQLIARQNDSWVMDLKDVASVSFKEKFIKEVLKKDPRKTYSPNPVGEENVARGIQLARSFARRVSAEMKFALNTPTARVVGIGGVHRFSIAGQTQKKQSYRLSDLMKALKKRAAMGDKQLGGEYAATEVTNLMLVAGFLEELAIQKVEIAKADIQDGVLLSKEAWK